MPFAVVAGIATAVTGVAAGVGIGAVTAGVIGAGVAAGVTGAGIGALGAAVTGGNPLSGAEMGGLAGLGGGVGAGLGAAAGIGAGVGGALGGAAAGAAGGALTGQNPLVGAITGGIGGYSYGTNVLPASASVSDADQAAIISQLGSQSGTTSPLAGQSEATLGANGIDTVSGPLAGQSEATLGANGSITNAQTASPGGPLASQSASISGGNGANGSNAAASSAKGINSTSLALGALSALGSVFSKPQQATYATPSPSSVAQSPYFNAPLNTNVPGRTAVNPYQSGLPANYQAYGGPEQTYFTNNNAAAFGLAKGGALSRAREKNTANGDHYIRGPGGDTGDKIPALLSDHEYVLDAKDMRLLGNGDPNKGAKKVDSFRRKLNRGNRAGALNALVA